MHRATRVGLVVLGVCVVGSVLAAPLPKAGPGLTVKLAGEIKLPKVFIHAAAFLTGEKLVVVGTVPFRDDDPDVRPFALAPNGAILDLAKKTHVPFTNEHTQGMKCVSVLGDRILTTSSVRDPYLRVWDTKANKPLDAVPLAKVGESSVPVFGVAAFHKGNRIAVTVDDRVLVFDPSKPKERVGYRLPDGENRWTNDKISISLDDAWIAAYGGKCDTVFWNIETKKATVVSLTPDKIEDDDNWSSRGVCFTAKGELLAWRSNGPAEVPAGKAEADVPADRRGVVKIDLLTGKVTPLKIGHTYHTFSCVADPTGTWLATGGSGVFDKPKGDETGGGELRIYHLPTQKLVFRDQVGGFPLTRVLFSPNGKRLVATTLNGIVRWWDVTVK